MARKSKPSSAELFDVVDGTPVAEEPATLEGLIELGQALEAAGFDSCKIDGEEWQVEPWGVSPPDPFEHPFIDEELSGIVGPWDAPTDRSVALLRIGSHWFEHDEFDAINHLGEFEDIQGAAKASAWFFVAGGGQVEARRPDDELVDLLASHGIVIEDPDDYHWWNTIGDLELLEAIADSELLIDQFGDFEEACTELEPLQLRFEEVRELDERSGSLPIGHEDLVDSIRWARADSQLREIPFAAALDVRIAAFERRSESLGIYGGSVVEISEGGNLLPAVEVAKTNHEVFAVLTAYNPMSIQLDDTTNTERNKRLAEILPGRREAVGRSTDGSWSEQSFAVPFTWNAIESAQAFGQAAIFRVTPDAVEVVELVGSSPRELARLTQRVVVYSEPQADFEARRESERLLLEQRLPSGNPSDQGLFTGPACVECGKDTYRVSREQVGQTTHRNLAECESCKRRYRGAWTQPKTIKGPAPLHPDD